MFLAIVKEIKNRKFFLILLLASAMYLVSLSPLLSLEGDDIGYIILARSIVSGSGYTNISRPDNAAPDPGYPFLPFLLTPLMLIFSKDAIIVFKLLTIFFSVSSILIFYLFLKENSLDKEEPFINAAVLIFAFNACFFAYSNRVLTEIPYTALSLLTLFIFQKYYEEKGIGKNNILFLTAISLSLVLLFYIRMAGLTLFFSIFVFMALRKDFKNTAVISLIFLLGIFPWLCRDISLSRHNPWQIWLTDCVIRNFHETHALPVWGILLRSMYHAFAYASAHLADLFCYPFLLEISKNSPYFAFKLLLGITIFAAILCGFLLQVKQALRLHHVYTFIYAVVISLFNVRGERYLLPLLPLLVFYFLTGLKALKAAGKNAVAPLVLSIFIMNSAGDVRLGFKYRLQPYTKNEISYLACASWIKENSPEDSIILCRKPVVMYMYSGRKSDRYPIPADFDKLKKMANDKRVDYFIADRLDADTQKYLVPFLSKYKNNLELVYTTGSPSSLVYKVKKRDF